MIECKVYLTNNKSTEEPSIFTNIEDAKIQTEVINYLEKVSTEKDENGKNKYIGYMMMLNLNKTNLPWAKGQFIGTKLDKDMLRKRLMDRIQTLQNMNKQYGER